MFCRNQTARATVARGSALEMEIRRGRFRRSVFLDPSQVRAVSARAHTRTHAHTLRVFTALIDLLYSLSLGHFNCVASESRVVLLCLGPQVKTVTFQPGGEQSAGKGLIIGTCCLLLPFKHLFPPL